MDTKSVIKDLNQIATGSYQVCEAQPESSLLGAITLIPASLRAGERGTNDIKWRRGSWAMTFNVHCSGTRRCCPAPYLRRRREEGRQGGRETSVWEGLQDRWWEGI
eukprot:2753315-Rhodomonas_salina.1